jgi:large subunit ribosomal protein L4
MHMETAIYTATGKKKGTIALPADVFGIRWNASLMHQVVTSMQDNARGPVAHVKDRGEVRGGGRKPWRQKGTGRARVGSSRSPIWVGGGVTHGPRNEKVYARTIPAKMRAKALCMALSKKLADGEVILVDSFGCEAPKTAVAKKALVALEKAGFAKLGAKKNAALIAFADETEATKKSFRNLEHISMAAVRNLNPVAVLGAKYLIIENPEAAVAILEARATKNNVKAAK